MVADTQINLTGRLTVESLTANPRQVRKERLIRDSLGITALISVLVSGLIIWSLFSEAWTFIVEVDWGAVWDIGWFPRRGIYDIKTLIVASLIITGIAMIVAGPLGLGAAIYLSEYARPGVRRTLKPILEVLAGIPSVVLGFFALEWIAPNVVKNLFGGPVAGSLLAAGIGVGVLVIPLVASISEDAMKAVPMSLREASSGLGARKLTTTVRVVLPAAISGLMAAFIVAISRALGETMVVFMAGGAAQTAVYTHDPLDGSLTMTAGMTSLARGTDNVVGEGLTFQSLFFVGLVLFVVTFGLNLLADRFVHRVREQY
ncbi:MAG: phosphate ABC transporter permease subunit PstC [Acidimicrobiia bacterium]|nr:phosphate ABC transporter permease subunit PstC [Acidimicrobiia bacterium]MYC57108.1 phosphate ABC transporter permease subunit PstC [Acidimicrobiia bacterium]MYG94790.1 phosphate ABC transporter permease subunit PstC [Acidimicrobiia bacterium]MYI30185.1 phosphate ABC transporter permease subunit PstC [Acidimicrobiia bacterium]